MTRDDFGEISDVFRTADKWEAIRMAVHLNAQAEGFRVIVIGPQNGQWGVGAVEDD